MTPLLCIHTSNMRTVSVFVYNPVHNQGLVICRQYRGSMSEEDVSRKHHLLVHVCVFFRLSLAGCKRGTQANQN